MTGTGTPDGSVYDWYHRGLQLLGERHPEAARAQYDAGRYDEAIASFTLLITGNPTDDYAHFGLGLAASRAGELGLAAEHLALASAMRPDVHHYAQALRGVRARRGEDPS